MMGLVVKAAYWAGLACNSNLCPQDFLISVSQKFWPKLEMASVQIQPHMTFWSTQCTNHIT